MPRHRSCQERKWLVRSYLLGLAKQRPSVSMVRLEAVYITSDVDGRLFRRLQQYAGCTNRRTIGVHPVGSLLVSGVSAKPLAREDGKPCRWEVRFSVVSQSTPLADLTIIQYAAKPMAEKLRGRKARRFQWYVSHRCRVFRMYRRADLPWLRDGSGLRPVPESTEVTHAGSREEGS